MGYIRFHVVSSMHRRCSNVLLFTVHGLQKYGCSIVKQIFIKKYWQNELGLPKTGVKKGKRSNLQTSCRSHVILWFSHFVHNMPYLHWLIDPETLSTHFCTSLLPTKRKQVTKMWRNKWGMIFVKLDLSWAADLLTPSQGALPFSELPCMLSCDRNCIKKKLKKW